MDGDPVALTLCQWCGQEMQGECSLCEGLYCVDCEGFCCCGGEFWPELL